jgi:PAS domain S-box-containing protein
MASEPFVNTATRMAAVTLFLTLVFVVFPGSARAAKSANIFILHSYSQEYEWTKGEHEGFVARMRAEVSSGALTFNVEYLDTKRVRYSSEYADMEAAHLAAKYAGVSPDAVYVTDDNALLFALSHLSRIFPESPVFFAGINDYDVQGKLPHDRFTGVFERKDIGPNLELIEGLASSRGTEIVFVGDDSETYRAIRHEVERDLTQHPGVRAGFLASGQIDALVGALRARPTRFVFLTTLGAMRDSTGRLLTLGETVAEIRKAGPYVIFSMEDAYLLPGVLGGFVTSGPKQGDVAASMVLRYLNGTRIADIEPCLISPNEYVIDEHELVRSGIHLPSKLDGVVRFVNPVPNFYHQHVRQIVGVLYSLVLLFVIALVISRSVVVRANRKLSASEARHRSMFQKNLSVQLLIDPSDGTLVDVNSAACDFYGYTSEQMRRMKISDINNLPPEQLARAVESIVGEQRTVFEFQHRRAGGDIRDVEVRSCPIPVGKRKLLYSVVRDITEWKRAERELGLVSARLERANLEVSELATQARMVSILDSTLKELRQTQLQLVQAQKLEAIGSLAAGIAHEINTPVQFVSDNMTFLGRAIAKLATVAQTSRALLVAEGDATAERERLAQAVKAARLDYVLAEAPKAVEHTKDGLQRISSIVAALKEFSHPSRQNRESVDVAHAIEATVTIARNEWKYVAEVETEFEPNMVEVPVFRGEFNQVMLNLIVNAAHAIGEANADNPDAKGKIRIATRTEQQFAVIEISDDGTGIPAQIRDRIFDPFFTTKPVGKGTGQGLAIVHNVIVKRHRGKIDLESEVGKGTTFVIRLPINATGFSLAP